MTKEFQHKYPHVYCPELNRMVMRSEVWGLLVGPNRVQKPLRFQCPDEGCRISLIAKRAYSYGHSEEVQLCVHLGFKHKTNCLYYKQKDKGDRQQKDDKDAVQRKASPQFIVELKKESDLSSTGHNKINL